MLYGQPESSGFERGQSANTAADRDRVAAPPPWKWVQKTHNEDELMLACFGNEEEETNNAETALTFSDDLSDISVIIGEDK